MSIQRCRTGWIRWMDPMALKLDRPPAIPFRLRAGCDASNIRRLLHRHPESRNQTVHFPESDCADSGIRLCVSEIRPCVFGIRLCGFRNYGAEAVDTGGKWGTTCWSHTSLPALGHKSCVVAALIAHRKMCSGFRLPSHIGSHSAQAKIGPFFEPEYRSTGSP